MGVFSTVDRRLTATGTIKFTPDLRAAVEIYFTMENAWQVENNVASKVVANNLIYKNYTKEGTNNPKVSETFTGPSNSTGINYTNLRFNPGASSAGAAEVSLKFKITNYSAVATALKVSFAEGTGNAMPVKNTTNAMGYVLPTFPTIAQGAYKEIVIKIQIKNLDATVQALAFNFNLTFSF